MTDAPRSPADPRPNGEPYYIDSDCPECGTALELFDPASGWYDEWWCPECDDGIYIDWPEEYKEKMFGRVESEDFKSLDKLSEEDPFDE